MRRFVFLFGLLAVVMAAGVLVFGVDSASAAATYTCQGSVALDEAVLQPLIDAGGTVIIKGPRHCEGNYTAGKGAAVVIEGGTAGATLDAQGSGSVLVVSDGTSVTLTNLTVTGGNTNFGCPATCGGADNDDGGGVSVDRSTLTVLNSVIAGNVSADEGGGIMAFDGATVSLTSATVSHNSATYHGGGITADCAPGLSSVNNVSVIASSIISNDTGHAGGGIYSLDGNLLVQKTNVSFNTAADFGGGIEFEGPAATCGAAVLGTHPGGTQPLPTGLTVTGSTIDHNRAISTASGGVDIYTGGATGVVGSDTPVSISHSAVEYNQAPYGGGVSSFAESGWTATLVATTSIFAGNQATFDGGAINNSTDGASGSLVMLSHAVALKDNTAVHGGGIWNDGAGANVSLQAGSLVMHNDASVTGGGVYNACNGSLSIGPGSVILFNTPNNIFNDPTVCP